MTTILKIMIREKRFCKECREEIFGRCDKQFCSDYCRATNYNKANGETTRLMRKVNYRINKNRRILARLNPSGKTKVPKKKLLESGLNFNYFTNTYQTRSGQKYFFCYDQGYCEMENQYVKILAKNRVPK